MSPSTAARWSTGSSRWVPDPDPASTRGILELDRLIRAGERVLDVLAGLLLLVILTVTLAQVAVRYLFDGSLTWSEELNLFLWV